MRLICPNCDAQYEVDESVIPDQGRDVQCSNCGHTWFQPGAYHASEAGDDLSADAAGDFADGSGDTEAEGVSVPTAADAGEDTGTSPGPQPADMPAPPAAPGASAMRQPIDEALLAVLREEAERESEARRAEGSSLETQPELGLAVAGSGAGAEDAATALPTGPGTGGGVPAEERVALVREAGHADDPAVARGARRGLLPDIEEINSTLSATRGRAGGGDDMDAGETLVRRRSGFRRGFSVALLAMFLMLALYVLAPSISDRIPAAKPMLDSYVAAVNSARVKLDALMKSSTEALRPVDGQGG